MGTKAAPQKRTIVQRRKPKQARARATVEAVLEAATRIIREQGAAGLTTNRVAERTGVSIGTLYGYFPDKQAILVAIARELLAADRAAIEAGLANASDDPIGTIIPILLQRHATDPTVRRIAMAAHIAEGHRGEHGENVDWFLTAAAHHDALRQIPQARFVIVTQAVLGIARALTEAPALSCDVPMKTVEAEVVRLVRKALDL